MNSLEDQSSCEWKCKVVLQRGKANGGKVESCSKIKDGNERLPIGEVKVQRIWKEYFEDLYIDTQEKVVVHVWL